MTSQRPSGPLRGVRVLELGGIGPAPFAGMLLADLGAEVVRVDRVGATGATERLSRDVVNRGKRSVALDLRDPVGAGLARRLAGQADVLVEGFRPGVAERLGLGPDQLCADNPGLVYARMTGWGQTGPLAPRAGHDIGYIALTGALWATGRAAERPAPPLNLLGDYAGGSMFLVVGVLAALLERAGSGRGQVVDAAMVDGTCVLATMFTALRAMGLWRDERGVNLLDSGAPFYEVYECADGAFLAVGALEPQFYRELVERTGFRADREPGERFSQGDASTWPADKLEWAALWRTRTRDEWSDLLAATDACVQPVLTWTEAPAHPHLAARGTFVELDGVVQPAPAPRFGRTPGAVSGHPPRPGEHTRAVLAELGLTPAEVDDALAAGAAAAD